MLSFSSSITALRANQAALNTVANNIANAGTPGYHRQQVQFGARADVNVGGHLIGSGVDIKGVYRQFNSIIEGSLLENNSLRASVDQQLVVSRQIETILGAGEGSIHTKLNNFYADLRSLSTGPDNSSKRLIAIERLQSLTNEINTISSRLTQVERDVERQIDADLDEVNRFFNEATELNEKIRREQLLGRNPNNMLDQLHQKVSQISEVVDVSVVESKNGGFGFSLFGGQYYSESAEIKLEKTSRSHEPATFALAGSDKEMEFAGGRLAGLQQLQKNQLTDVKGRLDSFAKDLIFQFDKIHSTGLPLSGEFEILASNRPVSDASLPLDQATSLGPLQAGSVFVSVTDTATGERDLHEMSFDPATQSLDDFAAAFNSIANLGATFSNNNQSISLYGINGHKFDFAGRFPTTLDSSGLTGSSVPAVSGDYTGSENDDFTFTFGGSGTVGVTDGLSVQVTDSTGGLVGNFDIGRGYEPGSDIEIGDGVKLSLQSGTIVDTEDFSVPTIQSADETGVLAAIGINSLFSGTDAKTIEVSHEVLDDPSRLALSRNGDAGNAGVIDRFAALRTASVSNNGTSTLEESVEQITVDIAVEVSQLTGEQTNFELIGNQLSQEIDSISGVDPNEEMVFLLQYQKAYEASVRVISTMDQVLSELFNILR